MSIIKDCPNRAQCIIDLLSRRVEERKSVAWTALLSEGQDLCNVNKEERALQSFEQSLKLSDDLAAVNDKDANRLKATALTCIGALGLCKNEISSAIVRFRQSASIFSADGDKYGEAVALFALAQAHEVQKDWREAFRYYELSQRALSHISSDSATIYLRQLVGKHHSEAVKEWEKMSEVTQARQGTLGFLPIFNRIPAGDPRSISGQPTDYIETDRLIIADKPYYVVSKDSSRLRLTFSIDKAYIAFRVAGDSMNNAGIDDGDYVILRTNSVTGSEPVPEIGDIVAVVFPDDNVVTLKRYRRKGTQVVFEPDSTNPSHKPFQFDKASSGFPGKIVGIHIATLKPHQTLSLP
jgi:SOS-response transcriptional repressor LexA